MENFELYISDINKCLQSIINIFKLQEIELNFNLLDKVNELDTNNLEDFVTPIPPIIVYKNQSFGDLPNPVRQYYDFKGWFLHFEKDENYIPVRLVWDNEILDYSKVLLSGNKVTLYAKWELKTIDITLDACGGTVEPKTIKCKLFDNLYDVIYNPIYPVKGPIKANNTFTGWIIDKTGQKISESTLLNPGISVLYAQYNLKFCKLSFNYNYKYNYQDIDASIIKDKNSFLSNFTEISGIESGTTINLVSYDSTPEVPLDPDINLIKDANISAKGKTFKGWSLLKNNPDTQFTVYIYDDTTLYSSWDPYEYKIIYKYSEESTTPLSVQTVKYNEVVSLIPYKTLFYTNPPENFTWGHSRTDHFAENAPVFIDNDMVENLKSSGDDNDVYFYPNDNLVEKFDSNAIILKNGGTSLKKYALDEPFYGLNFEISFSNNEKRHPTEILPNKFTSGVTDVTCFFGELSVKVPVQQNNSNGLSSVYLDLRDIQTKYRYGEFLNLENLVAVEIYENGSLKHVKYSEFPENFFTFPSIESFLTSDCTIYFGYKSITDGTIWPHTTDNKAMWHNTATSSLVQVERGEKSIFITDLPEKTTYIENNTLDLSGLTIFIEMVTNDVIPASLSNFNFKINPRTNNRLYEYNDSIVLNTSDSSVTVQYKENSAISTEFSIEVLQKQITSIDLLSGSSTQTIFNSNISEIEEIVNAIIFNSNENANLSLKIKYDNDTTSTVKINRNMVATGMISFDTFPSEDQLSQIFGEISFYIYYTPINNNLNRTTFQADFLVKKRFLYTICEFKIDNRHESINNNQLEINHIRNFNRNPLALECFASDNSVIVSEIIFSTFKEKINNETINDYVFSTNIDLKNFTKFRITSLENNSSVIYFDKDEMETYPTKSFINNYISSISYVVPKHCFYNSHIANISIENDLSIIYDYGFENDPKIISLVFSEKIQSIGDFAFANCPLLSSFTFNGKCPDFNPKNSFGQNAGDFTGNDASKREIKYLPAYSSDFIGEESKIYNTLSQKARPTYPFTFTILEND